MPLKKSMLCVAISILLLISCVPAMAAPATDAAHSSGKASAKPSAATVEKIYAKYRSVHGIKSCVIADLDGNGIPEMLCYYPKKHSCGVFSYNYGKRRLALLGGLQCGRSTPLMYYSTKRHKFVLYQLTTHSYTAKVFQVSGTKTRMTTTVESVYPANGKKWDKINGRIVSKSALNAFWNTVRGNYRRVDFKR